ncbi:MAG TPA: hypothetical protein VF743_00805 [Acidimicrobiales bacterium]
MGLLEREWAGLSVDSGAARRLAEVCAVAGGAGSLGGVEVFVRGAPPEAADRVLLALVTRAVDGDGLAARVALQLLLPGVRRLAARWWVLGDRDEREAAAVAAVWGRIVGYPVARRPGRVAANVVLDAGLDLRRAARAGTAGGWVPIEPVDPVAAGGMADPGAGAAGGSHPAVELVEVLVDAVASGVVSMGDAELVAASRIGGVSLAEIARRRGAPLRTLQWRRQRAEAALAATGTAA